MEDHHLLYQDLSKWSRATPVPCSKDFFPYLFPHLPRQLLFLLIPWLKSLFFIPQSYFLLKKKSYHSLKSYMQEALFVSANHSISLLSQGEYSQRIIQSTSSFTLSIFSCLLNFYVQKYFWQAQTWHKLT